MQKPFLGRRYALLSLALCSVVLSGCTTGSGSSGGGGGGGGGTPPEAPFNLGEISGVARLRGTTVNTAVGLFTGTGLLADIKTLSNNSGRAADLPGKIAYQHEATGASDLYLLTNEGRDLADLTVTSTSINKKPALSPNALKIAFTTTRDGNEEIYVMDINGVNLRRLTNNPFPDTDPHWSPDGGKITFSSSRDGNDNIYVMSADGTNATRLTNHTASDLQPSWSPDGTKIAFASNRDGNYDIYTMNADGTNQTRRTTSTSDEGYPDWSPDSIKVAYARFISGEGGRIFCIKADGTGDQQLLTGETTGIQPAWSPDGKKLIFAGAKGGVRGLFQIDADGKNGIQVSSGEDSYPSWRGATTTPPPFPISPRNFVGATGVFGSRARGFVYSNLASDPRCIFVFDSEATGDRFFMGAITDQPGEVVIYQIKAKDTTSTITKAGYWNWRTDSSPRLLGGSGLNVDLIFSAQTGEMMSALFSNGQERSAVIKEGGVRVLRGSYSSVWQEGVNLAPQGAKEVRVDAQSGRVLSLR